MRIVAKRSLREFYEQLKYQDAKAPLESWYREATQAEWKHNSDVQQSYRTADPIKDNRVVFDIGGHKYRLVVKFNFNVGIGLICFIGTHEEYNKIDANTVRRY